VTNILIESRQKGQKVSQYITEVADAYLTSKTRASFLQKMVGKNALFEIMDLKRDSLQEAIGSFVI